MTLSRQFVFLFILTALLSCGRKESDNGVGVTVVPSSFKIPAGGEVQFSADVSGTLDKVVTWQIFGQGSIGPTTGLYRSPLNVTSGTTRIQAVSQDDPNAFGNAAVTMTSFSELPGENVSTGGKTIVVGGYTVRPNLTIDLNGDCVSGVCGNIADLVTMEATQGKVAVYLGLGDGRFRKQAEMTFDQPTAIAVGDFINNPDFVADIAVASKGDGDIKIIKGALTASANESFAASIPGPPLDLTGKIPSYLVAGRFHGDVDSRNSDLVVGTEEGSIILFLQDRSTDSFTAQPPIPVGGKPVQMVPADFNGDELLDLAILREGASDVLILLGDGVGAFSSPITVLLGSPSTSLAVGEFDEDTTTDLAVAHATSNQVSISLGNGDGTFRPAQFTAVESTPGSIITGDFNLNKQGKRADIAVNLSGSKKVAFLFGDGTGRFIGKFDYNTTGLPLALISGFFTGFQSQNSTFQAIDFVYISINGVENKFYILTNTSF